MILWPSGLRRRPAKPMGSPRVGSNPTGVVWLISSATVSMHTHCTHDERMLQLISWAAHVLVTYQIILLLLLLLLHYYYYIATISLLLMCYYFSTTILLLCYYSATNVLLLYYHLAITLLLLCYYFAMLLLCYITLLLLHYYLVSTFVFYSREGGFILQLIASRSSQLSHGSACWLVWKITRGTCQLRYDKNLLQCDQKLL